MGLVLLSGPVTEPLTLSEVKAHLRVDGAVEDALMQSLMLTSRLHIEAALGLALITQSWRLVLDAWPADGIVNLPIAPIQSLTEIRVMSSDGTPRVVADTQYALDSSRRPARLIAKDNWPAPGRKFAGIEIDFVAGFGANASAVPEPIRQALLLLVAHWYEHRDPIEIGTPATAVPQAVCRLLHPYCAVRL